MKRRTMLTLICILILLKSTISWKPPICILNKKSFCIVTPPTPCPVNPLLKGTTREGERFNCSILDLRIAVSPPTTSILSKISNSNNTTAELDLEYGLLVRFYIPTPTTISNTKIKTNIKSTPLLLSFHGTGGCGLDEPAAEATCTCSPDIPCSLSDACKKFQVASEGVLVVSPAERGTSHCYSPTDPMTTSATWLGSLEWKDYDILIDGIMNGSFGIHLPSKGKMDATRVGVTGGSHGGLASFIYPRHSKAQSLLNNGVSYMFALSMPWEGTPDVGETWNKWQFDSETLALTNGRPISAGFLAGAGAISQLNAWPKSTLATELNEALSSGNFSSFVMYMSERTMYDNPSINPDVDSRSLSIFHNNVDVLLMHQGGRDCIVPGYGPRRGWEQLRDMYRTERPNDLWILDNYPHSCSATGPRFPKRSVIVDDGGYLPLWTVQLEDKTDGISSFLWVTFVRKHLLQNNNNNNSITIPYPALVATIGHDVSDIKYKQLNKNNGTLASAVDHYIVATLNTNDGKLHTSTTNATDAIKKGSTKGTIYLPVINQTKEMLEAGCPTPNSATAPCGLNWSPSEWKKSALHFEKILSKLVLPFATPIPSQQSDKWVLVGESVFEATLHLVAVGSQKGSNDDSSNDGSSNDGSAFLGAGIVVSLFYAPPDDSSTDIGWLVTQGMQYFDHVPNNGTRKARVVLDARLLAFETGGRLTVTISNVALQFVHHYPWVNPIGHPFSVEFVMNAVNDVTFTLPMSTSFAVQNEFNTSELEKPYWN